VGSVLGFLGQHVLGQYDIAIPRSGPGALLFVVPNIAQFEHDWSLDPTDFRTFVALHEVTHRFECARPWARERFAELLGDFLSTLKIDASAIQERLSSIDASDPEAMQALMGSEEGLFGAVLDDEQRIKLGRIQAFMSAAEGYGDHVMQSLGRELLPSFVRIEEAKSRLDTPNDPVFSAARRTSSASTFPRRTREDGRIDWGARVLDVYNLIRALVAPLPGAFDDEGVLDAYLTLAEVAALKQARADPGWGLRPRPNASVHEPMVLELDDGEEAVLHEWDWEARTARLTGGDPMGAAEAFALSELGLASIRRG